MQEKEITKADIKSFGEIAHANISSDMDSLNKLVYLRRLLEIENASGLAWQLLSNIFHKREKPEYHFSNGTPNRLMTPEEIQDATNEIKTNYISDFDYDTEYQKTQDITVLKELYQNSGSNYEKLQIYRIMFNENSSNSVIKKFVNEAFHIENAYLFQLNHVNTILYPNISLMNVIKIFWKFVRKANVSGLVGLTWLQVIKDNYF